MKDSIPASTTTSLRNRLLLGSLLPLLVFTVIEAGALYQTLSQTVRDAYDQFLIAAVYSVADSLHAEGGNLRGALPLAVREAFEAAGGSRVFYRVSTPNGELIAGDPDLPVYVPDASISKSGFRPVTPTLSNTAMRDMPVRMAVLYQPVEMSGGQLVALIQVAHTLEARDMAARTALLRTLGRQALFMLLIALSIWLVVVRLLKPVDRLRSEVDARSAADLSPLREPELRELSPVVIAFNQLMGRQAVLLRQQERFIADASHQLRTPLTVLKTQLQSALGEPAGAGQTQAIAAMEQTVDRVNALSQQILSLARVHQANARAAYVPVDLAQVTEQAALELSPLLGKKRIQFSLTQTPVTIWADDWMPGELVRNVLQNAIRFTPEGGMLAVTVGPASVAGVAGDAESDAEDDAVLCVEDSGPGIADALLPLVFEPFFSEPGQRAGTGLGLAICRDITDALGGSITLENITSSANTSAGLQVRISLPRRAAQI